MNERLMTSTLIATALAAANAHASHRDADESTVRAPVVSSVPIYRTINEPRTECWTETVGYRQHVQRDSNGGAVLGAIFGGLVGSTVGKGDGRVAAAAIGAATGAVVGDRMDGRYAVAAVPEEVERCRTTDRYRRVVQAYDVRYRFQGQEYRTRLPYDPGRAVTLRLNVEVVDDRDDDR